MIQGVSSGGNIGLEAVTALRYAHTDGQALILPVRPAQMINARFKHIQMRPDSSLQNGIPLYKLKILDTLIDQLSRKDVRAAGESGAAPPAAASRRADAPAATDAGSVDAMIAALSAPLRDSDPSYRARFLPEPGAFVDLLA
jgi:hypothetical protein